MFLILPVIIIWISCEIFTGPVEISNPWDPSDPDFVPPSLTFTSGLNYGDVVDTNYVTFAWYGNQPNLVFYGSLDSRYIYPWGTDTCITFDYLTEGLHTFRISPRYLNGILVDSTVTVEFEINDVQGPAMIIWLRDRSYQKGEYVYLPIYAEEVTGLASVSTQIKYNPSVIRFYQKYTLRTSFLELNGGKLTSSYSYDNSKGTLNIDLAITGGNPPSVSGRGILAEFVFTTVGTGSASFTISDSSEMRDENNNRIEILNLVDTEIEVTP